MYRRKNSTGIFGCEEYTDNPSFEQQVFANLSDVCDKLKEEDREALITDIRAAFASDEHKPDGFSRFLELEGFKKTVRGVCDKYQKKLPKKTKRIVVEDGEEMW